MLKFLILLFIVSCSQNSEVTIEEQNPVFEYVPITLTSSDEGNVLSESGNIVIESIRNSSVIQKIIIKNGNGVRNPLNIENQIDISSLNNIPGVKAESRCKDKIIIRCMIKIKYFPRQDDNSIGPFNINILGESLSLEFVNNITEEPASNKIIVQNQNIDFGNLKEGDIISETINIKNISRNSTTLPYDEIPLVNENPLVNVSFENSCPKELKKLRFCRLKVIYEVLDTPIEQTAVNQTLSWENSFFDIPISSNMLGENDISSCETGNGITPDTSDLSLLSEQDSVTIEVRNLSRQTNEVCLELPSELSSSGCEEPLKRFRSCDLTISKNNGAVGETNISIDGNDVLIDLGDQVFFAEDGGNESTGDEMVYFMGRDPLSNNKTYIYKTDGNTAPELLSGSSSKLKEVMGIRFVYDNKLFFTAKALGETNTTLFTYDKNIDSIEVFTIAENINAPNESAPAPLFIYNNELYLRMNDGSGDRLWRYDGTNITIVTDIVPNADDFILRHFIYNNELYLYGRDANVNKYKVWKYDELLDTVEEVSSINNALSVSSGFSSFYTRFDIINNKVIFTHNDGTHGNELWEYDGVNTYLIKDINQGSYSAAISHRVNYNNKLYFVADDGIYGAEIWEYDGVNDPKRLTDLFAGNEDGIPLTERRIIKYNNKLYFVGNNGDYINAQGYAKILYEYDGISNPSIVDYNIFYKLHRSVESNNILFFQGRSTYNGSDTLFKYNPPLDPEPIPGNIIMGSYTITTY